MERPILPATSEHPCRCGQCRVAGPCVGDGTRRSSLRRRGFLSRGKYCWERLNWTPARVIRHAKSPLEILEMTDGSARLRPCLLRGNLHVFAPISRCGRGGLCYVVLVWRAESEAVTLVRTGSHHAKAIASHFVAPGDHPDPAVVRNIAPWTRITIIKNCFYVSWLLPFTRL